MECIHYRLLNRRPVQLKNKSGFSPVKEFKKPATSKGPKLYLVKHRNEVLYVGITSQSISSRLRYGFTATGKGGYHGYKWKDKKEELDLLIWHFPDKGSHYVESIEAELVFLIRQRTGRWPSLQTEIHFHNTNKNEKAVARELYRCLQVGRVYSGR